MVNVLVSIHSCGACIVTGMGLSQSYPLEQLAHSLCKAQTPGGFKDRDKSQSHVLAGLQTKVSRKDESKEKRKLYGVESPLKTGTRLETDIRRLDTVSKFRDIAFRQQGNVDVIVRCCAKTDQPMDDYIEPKDSKKLQLGVHTSPLSTNHYSDDDDDDDYRYSQPYHSVPGPGGRPVGKTGAGLGPDQDADDGYEIVPDQLPLKTKTLFDYDVPPAPRKSLPGMDQGAPTPALKPSISTESPDSPEDYFRLKYNGTSAVQAGRGKSVVSENEQHSDGEDSYNHTSSWLTQKTERQKSGSSNPPPSPVKPASGTPFATRTAANRQNSNGSITGTSPVFKTSAFKSPPPQQESAKTFMRQKAIHPRKSSSGVADTEAGSQPSSGPAIYEEAWDTAQQQRRLEENLRLARSISACSDTFEDALEFLPEDWTPSKAKAGSRKTQDSGRTGPRTVDPVTGGEYEPAWDLNRGLEEKLRSLQAAHPESGEGAGGDGNYQEPWDLAQKQRELEKKIERARAEGGRGNARSPQQQQQQQQQQSSGGGELYEMPWDTKKGLAHMLQSSQSVEGQRSLSGSYVAPFSPKPSQSVSGAIGEPINAMIPLNNQEWYHGNISRDDAERMLRVCKDGSYLVRDSSDRCHYTLSIKSAIQTIHIQIDQCQKADGSMRYILGKNSKAFQTIPSMIDHYTHHIVPIKGAEHMTLLYPVHCKYSGGEESQV